MHSDEHDGVSFLFNSDCSGDIHLIVKKEDVKQRVFDDEYLEVHVSYPALFGFVVERVKRELISRVEDIDARKVWSLLTGRPMRRSTRE